MDDEKKKLPSFHSNPFFFFELAATPAFPPPTQNNSFEDFATRGGTRKKQIIIMFLDDLEVGTACPQQGMNAGLSTTTKQPSTGQNDTFGASRCPVVGAPRTATKQTRAVLYIALVASLYWLLTVAASPKAATNHDLIQKIAVIAANLIFLAGHTSAIGVLLSSAAKVVTTSAKPPVGSDNRMMAFEFRH